MSNSWFPQKRMFHICVDLMKAIVFQGVSSLKADETSKVYPQLTFIFSGEGVHPASMLGLYIPVFAVWLFSYACSRRPWGCTITRQHFRKVGPMGLQGLPHDLRLNHVAPYHAVHMGCAYVYICIYTHVDDRRCRCRRQIAA